MRFARSIVPGAALLVSAVLGAVLGIATSTLSAQTDVLGRVFGRARIATKRAWLRFSAIAVSLLAALLIVFGSLAAFSADALAQNPVPFVNQPLVPDATAPGGPQFTLTVNGTGFALGSVVNWNTTALATQFVSASQLTATVPAVDIVAASTASVTVLNPTPGGARSNVVFFTVAVNTGSSLVFSLASSPPTGDNPSSVAVGDFNGDGKLDLAVVNIGSDTVSILLGDGTGNFTLASSPAVGSHPSSVAVGDFNGDGELDLAVANELSDTVSILLGDGMGNFTLTSTPATGSYPSSVAVGDFNGDGNLDLAVANSCAGQVPPLCTNMSILLGDGTGNFTLASSPAVGSYPDSVAVGDFNGDGKVDLAVADYGSDTVSILLGDGTGNFTLGSSPAVGSNPLSVAVADFNGDGKLDLAVLNAGFSGTVSILLGDGTGNFTLNSTPATGNYPSPVAVGDFNGDGKLDLAVADDVFNTVSILLGDGTGNFTLTASLSTGTDPDSVAVGDFNGDGRLDLAVANGVSDTISILLQAPTVVPSPSSLSFGAQLVSTTSGPQTVALTNTGSAELNITAIAASGDYAQTNPCGGSVGIGATCTISATFTPTQSGTRTGTITVTDNAPGSPQTISLTGTGVFSGPNVTLSPGSVVFPSQTTIHTTSAPQTITLENYGSAVLTVTGIGVTGDFAETNTCGNSVPSTGSCTISVTFTPTQTGTRTGSVTVTDNASGSPQSVLLTGSSNAFAPGPVPLINQPLYPEAVAPGGAGFTLTVNGTGFVSGAVVNWNGSPLATTFVGGSQLTAAVPAADIATASTASVTVLNPGPGAAASNVASFEVTTGTSAVAFNTPMAVPGVGFGQLFVADLNNDGKLDLVVGFQEGGVVSILLGNGDGTFQAPVSYSIPFLFGTTILTGDFNNDGKLDLVIGNAILLGNGDGTFQPALEVPISGSMAADFNGDGKLDLAALVSEGEEGPNVIAVALGNGDGTFEAPINSPATGAPISMNAGDFNGDGKLDLAVATPASPFTENAGSLFVQFGNGDGTFQGGILVAGPGTNVNTSFFNAVWMGIADVNGDGKLDVVTTSCFTRDIIAPSYPVFLGNGDGTFSTSTPFGVAFADTCPSPGVIADFNGDGKLDLASVNLEPPPNFGQPGPDDGTLSILLGNGDGSYQSLTVSPMADGFPYVVGDFNGDGRLDLAFWNGTVLILLQQAPAIALSPLSLSLSSSSPVQTVSVTNISGAPLDVTDVSISGGYVGETNTEFAQTNTCGTSLATGASCTVSVTLTPAAGGNLTGSLTISYNGAGSPQTVALTAIQSGLSIENETNIMNPASIGFGPQAVDATSGAQELYLFSTGTAALAITSITTSGDFAESNTCGTSVAAGSVCTMLVTFTPTAPGTRTGTLIISDNAPGSPQVLSLTGTGTVSPAVTLSSSTVAAGGQVVGTTSAAHTVTLTNTGNAALNITSIAIAPAAFTEINKCGASLAAGASCTITVTFTPSLAGDIAGMLSITDNASGSPQQVTLSGTGQDFSIGPYNLTTTIPAGFTAAYDLAVSPQGGFNQTVSLACSGAPQQSSCTVTPTSATLDGRTHAVITLRVLTSAPAGLLPMDHRLLRLPPGWLLAEVGSILWLLTMLATEAGRRLAPRLRLRHVLTPAGALLLFALVWVGCGGGGSFVMSPPATGGTPSGTYAVTVTATSGHLSHAVTVQLTVR